MPLASTKPLSAEEWEAVLLRRRGGDPARTWVTVPEAAALLYVVDETIRNWCKAGVLDYVRVGRQGRFRIPIRSLAEHLIEDAPEL
jgi:excisionase family DNA binding protein